MFSNEIHDHDTFLKYGDHPCLQFFLPDFLKNFSSQHLKIHLDTII